MEEIKLPSRIRRFRFMKRWINSKNLHVVIIIMNLILASIAYQSLNVSKQSLRVGNQAYVLVQDIQAGTNKTGDTLFVSVIFKNFGKTPAQKVGVAAKIRTDADCSFSNTDFVGMGQIGSVGILGNDEFSHIQVPIPDTLKPIIANKQLSLDTPVYIYGAIFFNDIFNVEHMVTFCYRYKYGLNDFVESNIGNEIKY